MNVSFSRCAAPALTLALAAGGARLRTPSQALNPRSPAQPFANRFVHLASAQPPLDRSRTARFALASAVMPAEASPPREVPERRLQRLCSRIMKLSVEAPATMREVLAEFQTAKPSALEKLLGRKSEDAIHRALAFSHRHGELRRENFMILSRGDDDAILLSVLTDRTDPKKALGFSLCTLYHEGPLRKVAHHDYIVMDTSCSKTRDLADSYLDQVSALLRRSGFRSEQLVAGWVGRLVWAQKGFDFANLGGSTQLNEFKERFSNFLEFHHVAPADLEFVREDGRHEPFRFGALRHSWDFAQVVSSEPNGGKLAVDVLSGENRIERQRKLDVGRAFLLGNKRDDKLEPIVAPMWRGSRPLDSHSAGQRQFAAYRQARSQR